MPELNFMIICDYVRADGGVLHMIAGGLDTITARAIPAARGIGIGLGINLLPGEATESHTLRLVFRGTDGAPITDVGADLPARSEAPDLPPGRTTGVVTGVNMSLPLPAYGDYTVELLVDDSRKKTVPIHVVPPAEHQPRSVNPGLACGI